MRFKVLRYMAHENCHECEDEGGRRRFLDLFVSGKMPKGADNESIVGKTVVANHFTAYTEIAHDAELEE